MNLKGALKLLISVGMIAVALHYVSLRDLRSTLLKIPPSTLVVVCLVYMFGQLLSAFKWWLISRSGKTIDVPFGTALKAYFVGMYVNCFVGFGTVGGDLTRGILLGHGNSARTEGVFSVVADRVHGLLVLSLIALIGIAVTQRAALDPLLLYSVYGGAIAIVIGWFVGPSLLLKLVPLTNSLRPKIEGIASVFPKSPRRIIIISAVSLAFHLIQLSLHRVIALGFGVDLPWSLIFTVVPFVNILSSLPISWQGLGVRETGYIFFLGSTIGATQAAAFGPIWLSAIITCSAIGGVIAVITGDLKIIRRNGALA